MARGTLNQSFLSSFSASYTNEPEPIWLAANS